MVNTEGISCSLCLGYTQTLGFQIWWQGCVEGYIIVIITYWDFVIVDSVYQFH